MSEIERRAGRWNEHRTSYSRRSTERQKTMEMNRKRKRGRRCDVTPSPPLMKSEKAQMAGEKEIGGKKCVCVGGGE